MKLKRQPRPPQRRAPRKARGARAARSGATPRGRQARRPGIPLRRRIGRRLPSIRRLLAGLGAAAAAAALVALVSGPWLRVTDVTWAGEQFTTQRDLERVLEQQRGTSLLAVDTRSLRERLEQLPAVAEATVTASLPGRLQVTIVEREASVRVGDLVRAAARRGGRHAVRGARARCNPRCRCVGPPARRRRACRCRA